MEHNVQRVNHKKTPGDYKMEKAIKEHYEIDGFVLVGYGKQDHNGESQPATMISTCIEVGFNDGEVHPIAIMASEKSVNEHFHELTMKNMLSLALDSLKKKTERK